MADYLNIAGRVRTTANDGVTIEAQEIKDLRKEQFQQDINQETDEHFAQIDSDLDSPSGGVKARLSTLENQVAFSGEFQAENTPQGIISESGKIATANAVRGAIDVRTGYFLCETAAATAAKTVIATGFILTTGGNMKIKMTNENTADNATLNINSTGAKDLYYAGERVSSNNSWEAGETVEVYYDGTNYYANNVAGGSGSGDGAFDISAKTGNSYSGIQDALIAANSVLSASKKKGGMSIKFIQSDNSYVQFRYMSSSTAVADFTNVANWQGVDDEPTAGSKNLVESGGVYNRYSELVDTYFQFNLTGYIKNTGAIKDSEGYVRTDFIPVREHQKFIYKGAIGASFLCIAGYFSADTSSFVETILSGGTYSEEVEITIPSGVNYIIACSKEEAIHKLTLKNYYDYITSESVEGMVENVQAQISSDSIAFSLNGFIKANGAIGSSTSQDYVRTDFIKVSEGDSFLYKGKITGLCVAGYSSADTSNFVESIVSGGDYKKHVLFTVPSGVNYIMACSKSDVAYDLTINSGSIDNRLTLVEDDLEDLDNEPTSESDNLVKSGGVYAWVKKASLPNEYYGKTINWLGDSIVAGSFDDKVAEYFGMNENDYGIGGSTIAKDANDTRNSMAVRYSSMSNNADVIVVSGGTNDYQYSWTPFGQIGDNTVDTFFGALDVLCRGLIAKYPNKIIFFTTPIKRNQDNNGGSHTTYPLDTAQDHQNDLGKYLKDYCDAIKEVCAKYSIPVLDLYSESLLNPNMSAQAGYFDNVGTHPTGVAGAAIMARRVRGFMKQLC